MRAITPRAYVCGRAGAGIQIDGRLDDAAWAHAPWSEEFVDIEGPHEPEPPPFRTHVKLLWDDDHLYVAADLAEPHVVGKMTEKNSRLYNENAFEIFIDPDGDHHDYYEFEINARGTIWELSLSKPYVEGGRPTSPRNLPGLRSAVAVRGTLGDPADEDAGWTVEVAIPWKDLAAFNPGRAAPPDEGDYWRMNLARVQWDWDIDAGKYVRRPESAEYWVWSPHGIIDMHRPQRFGYVRFAAGDQREEKPAIDPTHRAREALLEIYHRQRGYRKVNGRWATTLAELGLGDVATITVGADGWSATKRIAHPDGPARTLRVYHDSRIEVER